jgi:hypothetical protein
MRSDNSLLCCDRRSRRAELHWGVSNFFAACAQSNCSDDGGENDSALHGISPIAVPGSKTERGLVMNLTNYRNVRANLHRLMRNFFPARPKRECCQNDRDRNRVRY